MNGNFDQYINNCDNLDEQISVTDFIKTLKKVESSDTLNGRDSGSSHSSTDKLARQPMEGVVTAEGGGAGAGSSSRHLKVDKKASANDLLQNMRKRFVHRATEPIFHALPEAQEGRRVVSGRADAPTGSASTAIGEPKIVGGEPSSGSEDLVKMPSFDTSLDRKTDSEPSLSRTRNKYQVP